MRKNYFAPAFAIFIAFLLVALPTSINKALALNACEAQQTKPGYSVDGRTYGSVVMLCANFVADQTRAKPNAPAVTVPAPTKKPRAVPPKIKPKPLDPGQRAKLLHRRLAMKGNNSFSPTALLILASAKSTKPRTQVSVTVAHPTQFRTAYLINRFVSLRFTPVKINFHYDAKTRIVSKAGAPFGSSVKFLTHGWHVIRGIVTYRCEFRVNGEKLWRPVVGAPTLAARPARVLVLSGPASNQDDSQRGKPYLVADDCLFRPENRGCLN